MSAPKYRAAVRLGPFESEARLRQLCAENGVSVVETLRAVNAGVSARWLTAVLATLRSFCTAAERVLSDV